MKANYSKFLKILVSPFAIIAQVAIIWIPLIAKVTLNEAYSPTLRIYLTIFEYLLLIALGLGAVYMLGNQALRGKVNNAKNILVSRVLLAVLCFIALYATLVQAPMEVASLVKDLNYLNSGKSLPFFTNKEILSISNSPYSVLLFYRINIKDNKNLMVWFNAIKYNEVNNLKDSESVEYLPHSGVVYRAIGTND